MKKQFSVFLGVILLIALSCHAGAAEANRVVIQQASPGLTGLAVDANGTLWGWGDNSQRTLDDIGSGDRLDPWTGPYQTTPIRLMENVVSASSGFYTLALKTDGTLWRRGQETGWTQILDHVTAIDQGAAIREDGSLWLWGDNRYGKLAPGGIQESESELPVKVMENVKAVSIDDAVMVIKTDNTLWSWGLNFYCQLGTGHAGELQYEGVPYRDKPVQILTHVVRVTTGDGNAFAVREDGTLWAWGRNLNGELGGREFYNATGEYDEHYQTVPVQVMTDVADVAAGTAVTYILKTDGCLWACGSNQFGEAGIGCAGEAVDKPTKIMDQVAYVSADDCGSFAIKKDGTLWSWGVNWYGELGYFGGDSYDIVGPQQTSPRQVLFGNGVPAPLQTELFVTPSTAEVQLDERKVTFPVLMSFDVHGGGTTYVRLRDLAYALSNTDSAFSVETWPVSEMTFLRWRGWYEPVGGEMVSSNLSAQTVQVVRSTFDSSSTRGVEYYHTISVTDTEGNSHMYVRLRDLADSHYFDVAWDKGQIIIHTGTSYKWNGELTAPSENIIS